MKMSRTINEYKNAMDSIKISESFYKRTEALLNDLSEDRIENNRSVIIRKRVSAGILSAAACIVCIIGIRVVLDVRNENIESLSETGLTSISTETVTEVRHSPELIDIPEAMDNDFGQEEPVFESESGAAPAADTSAAVLTDETSADSPAMIYDGMTGFSIPVPEIEEGMEGVHNDSSYAEDEEAAEDDSDASTGAGGEYIGFPDIRIEGRNDIPDLENISPENVRLEITPYINSRELNIENYEIDADGTAYPDILGMLKTIPSGGRQTENGDFRTVFMVQIAEKETGDIFYSIYITDEMNAVITKHSDPQERNSYILGEDKYIPLTKALFMLYGSEEDYSLFESIIGGK